jgi:DNA-binding CsgD family transcriptional regulator
MSLSKDKRSFGLVPEKTRTVRMIFELCIAGLGTDSIARQLEAKDVPPFGPSGKWHPSTIHNILSNRATVGEYQAREVIRGKRRLAGNPAPNYYPAVIDETLFNLAQDARRSHVAGRRAEVNLFEGISSCLYCGSPMEYRSYASRKTLVCARALQEAACHRFGWSYSNFEAIFLEYAGTHQFDPELSDLIKVLESESRERDIFGFRIDLRLMLRTKVPKVVIAVAGEAPGSKAIKTAIRTEHPNRYFEFELADGTRHVVRPDLAKVDMGPKISTSILADVLSLSSRQAELTSALVEGLSLTEAAQRIGVSRETARWHLREIFLKTKTHSQADLTTLALTEVAHSISQPSGKSDHSQS